jgi:hypothetical protein
MLPQFTVQVSGVSAYSRNATISHDISVCLSVTLPRKISVVANGKIFHEFDIGEFNTSIEKTPNFFTWDTK